MTEATVGVRLLLSTTAAGRALGLTDRQVRRLVTDGALANHGTRRCILLHVGEVAELDATRQIAELRRLRGRLDGCPLRSA